MNTLDVACGTPRDLLWPNSMCVRWFHLVTGKKDTVKVVEDFASKVFLVILCTMVLAMGQNWSRVCRVMRIGPGDPSTICQMIFHAGGDG